MLKLGRKKSIVLGLKTQHYKKKKDIFNTGNMGILNRVLFKKIKNMIDKIDIQVIIIKLIYITLDK